MRIKNIGLNLTSLFLALVVTMTAAAQKNSESEPFPSRSTDDLSLLECTAHLIEDIDLPAQESGQIREMHVKPGDSVNKEQTVAQMNDQRSKRAFDEATLRFQIADERANDGTEVETAYKQYQLAWLEHTKSEKLRRNKSVSDFEADRAKFSAEVAQLKYEGAKKSRELAVIEAAAEMVTVKASEDSIERHKITSPIDGQVFEIFREAGEWVTAGETVMRIARMDRLRVIGIVKGNAHDPIEIADRPEPSGKMQKSTLTGGHDPIEIADRPVTSGKMQKSTLTGGHDPIEIADRPVTVTLELARGRQLEFTGKVVFVDFERRSGDQYLVWAEVDNRTESGSANHWALQPGAKVGMQIHLGQPPVQSAFAGNAGGSDELQK